MSVHIEAKKVKLQIKSSCKAIHCVPSLLLKIFSRMLNNLIMCEACWAIQGLIKDTVSQLWEQAWECHQSPSMHMN